MQKRVTNRSVVLGCLCVLPALFSVPAEGEARPTPSRADRATTPARRRSVIDYFNLLPQLGIGYEATPQARRELLKAENHPVIDARHDYLRVHPDSSPVEQIVVFRARHRADLLAVSMPDSESDYNDFALFRLENGKLRNVTAQIFPLLPDTDRFLYELPRSGTTIRVFRLNIAARSRRHVFDLQWRGGRFISTQ